MYFIFSLFSLLNCISDLKPLTGFALKPAHLVTGVVVEGNAAAAQSVCATAARAATLQRHLQKERLS